MRGQGLPHIGVRQEGKRSVQECKKPAVPGNDKISSVEGIKMYWIRCFLSKVMALWAEIVVSHK